MSCAFCGMPPRDGEPCCTSQYKRDTMKRADAKIARLERELESLRAPTPRAPEPSPAKAEAPSVEECVDALLRVQPFRDGHETGTTGLVRRADVEQAIRACFAKSNPAPAPSRAQGVDVEAVVHHMNALGWGKADQTCLGRDLRTTFKALGISTAEGGGDNG